MLAPRIGAKGPRFGKGRRRVAGDCDCCPHGAVSIVPRRPCMAARPTIARSRTNPGTVVGERQSLARGRHGPAVLRSAPGGRERMMPAVGGRRGTLDNRRGIRRYPSRPTRRPEDEPMNKRELSSRVAAAASLSRTEAAAVSAVFSVIADAPAAGGTVTVPGFDTFATGHRAARQGRNPRTGERGTIPASKAPAFKHRQSPPRGGQVPPHDDCAAGPCPATVRAASADAGRGCRASTSRRADGPRTDLQATCVAERRTGEFVESVKRANTCASHPLTLGPVTLPETSSQFPNVGDLRQRLLRLSFAAAPAPPGGDPAGATFRSANGRCKHRHALTSGSRLRRFRSSVLALRRTD